MATTTQPLKHSCIGEGLIPNDSTRIILSNICRSLVGHIIPVNELEGAFICLHVDRGYPLKYPLHRIHVWSHLRNRDPVDKIKKVHL